MKRNMKKSHPEGSKKSMRMRDGILILAVLLCGITGILFWHLSGATGDLVTVSVDGKRVATYPLSEDRQVELSTGTHGEGRNVLRIQDGKADILEASCPDGICVDHHPISREGESIICLPNRMVVTIQKQ